MSSWRTSFEDLKTEFKADAAANSDLRVAMAQTDRGDRDAKYALAVAARFSLDRPILGGPLRLQQWWFVQREPMVIWALAFAGRGVACAPFLALAEDAGKVLRDADPDLDHAIPKRFYRDIPGGHYSGSWIPLLFHLAWTWPQGSILRAFRQDGDPDTPPDENTVRFYSALPINPSRASVAAINVLLHSAKIDDGQVERPESAPVAFDSGQAKALLDHAHIDLSVARFAKTHGIEGLTREEWIDARGTEPAPARKGRTRYYGAAEWQNAIRKTGKPKPAREVNPSPKEVEEGKARIREEKDQLRHQVTAEANEKLRDTGQWFGEG